MPLINTPGLSYANLNIKIWSVVLELLLVQKRKESKTLLPHQFIAVVTFACPHHVSASIAPVRRHCLHLQINEQNRESSGHLISYVMAGSVHCTVSLEGMAVLEK
jgi:hypothetical protein